MSRASIALFVVVSLFASTACADDTLGRQAVGVGAASALAWGPLIVGLPFCTASVLAVAFESIGETETAEDGFALYDLCGYAGLAAPLFAGIAIPITVAILGGDDGGAAGALAFGLLAAGTTLGLGYDAMYDDDVPEAGEVLTLWAATSAVSGLVSLVAYAIFAADQESGDWEASLRPSVDVSLDGSFELGACGVF